MTNTNPIATNSSAPSEPRDALTEFELEVARRADELARARPLPTMLNLHCWLVAEAEVLASRAVASSGLSAAAALAN